MKVMLDNMRGGWVAGSIIDMPPAQSQEAWPALQQSLSGK